MPLSGEAIATTLERLGITHVVWLPDSHLGTWEVALTSSAKLQLIRVCREGEAWAIAAGLMAGGARPVVIIQCTGLFESGDSLRNVVYDLGLPIYGLVGYRGYLVSGSTDSARRFTEPIVAAWQIDHVLLDRDDGTEKLEAHYRACQQTRRAGIALVAEGRG
jgi:sulfopyruvate decarboxylase TPP-binding subunit